MREGPQTNAFSRGVSGRGHQAASPRRRSPTPRLPRARARGRRPGRSIRGGLEKAADLAASAAHHPPPAASESEPLMRWPDRPVEIGRLAMTAASNHPVRTSLAHAGTEPARARRLVADACEGLPEDLVTRAQLLTSELVTNAVMYGDGELELRVRRSPDQVAVEVLDQSREEPQLLPLDPDRPGGNGLRLVQALAHEWGIAHFPRSKSVWFVVR